MMGKGVEAKFNCFVYAFGLDSDPVFLYFNNTAPNINISGKKVSNLIKYKKLIQVKEPNKGDYVIYFRNEEITHMGIFFESNFVISKWGTENFIQKHKIEDAYEEYGNTTLFYKQKSSKEIRNLLIGIN